MKIRKLIPYSILFTIIFSGCYIESHETNPPTVDPFQSSEYPSDYSSIPDNYLLLADLCENKDSRIELSEGAKKKMCFENTESQWNTTCRGYSCQAVPVYIQYMLSEDLGEGRSVTVEAFDNPYFSGSPVSSVTLNNFTATKAGEFQKTSLYLGSGTYYARAFISKASDVVIPYEYSDMQLIQNQPLGIFGALSSPATITVARDADEDRQPAYITIDKLFKKPQSAKDQRAFLRLKLNTEKLDLVESDRNVMIQLHSESDIQMEPIYQFKIPSAAFKVEGHQGETEFVSDSLDVGRYYVFVYLDGNGNGYFDPGELAQYFGHGGDMKTIDIKEKRTKYLALTLVEELDVDLN